MLRVVEHYSGTDTGRARRANEDALLAQAPLFVVADGMGGAQAGEVASRIAVETFLRGLPDGDSDHERDLSELIAEANARIHQLSRNNAEQAGMGTTLTALYVGGEEVTLAHVGDSRAYCLRDGELMRLTEDHSLVDELIRQGRLTPAEAEAHPQRSVITRALGPEPTVQVDTCTHRARAGDIYLICSDGLTTMLSEPEVASIIASHATLREAGDALLRAANDAGGRDNITVILLRLDEADGTGPALEPPTISVAPAATGHRAGGLPRRVVAQRQPRPGGRAQMRRRRRPRILLAPLVLLAILGILAAGAYLASQSVYFLGTNSRGLVTLYTGFPYELPGGIALYSTYYVSGVPAATVAPERRRALLDNTLRSRERASQLVRSLELEELVGQ